ncbi:programmed cell death protein 1-like isoform X2 [Ascaphus truei]|uniref:programmed cell death protein 1-like isoform X2 n=1 Tax=Ascaphus truei TaxID=8439 RepID=UPI003F5A310C
MAAILFWGKLPSFLQESYVSPCYLCPRLGTCPAAATLPPAVHLQPSADMGPLLPPASSSADMGSLLKHEGSLMFTHLPRELVLSPGQEAVFICNISGLNYSPNDISWYKTGNISIKIADLKTLEANSSRVTITLPPGSQLAELHIKDVTVNDSGEYECGIVSAMASNKIMLSNRSRLNVTGSVKTTPAVAGSVTAAVAQNVTAINEKTNAIKISIISAASVLTVLLLLICIVFILVWRKQRNKTPQSQLKHLEKPPQYPAVYSVDYGVVEFQSSRPYRKSAELCAPEQVEYATILFPQRTPSPGEPRGRKAA